MAAPRRYASSMCGTDRSGGTFVVIRSRHRREFGGIQRRRSVKKAKLLSTVAAVLLLGAGAASAQGMNKEAPQQAPAAQQNAPAEKVAPSVKPGEHKAPQTTGQATPDAKSPNAHETTGQSPKSDADDKASTQNRAMDKDKSKTNAMDKDKS